MDEKNTPRWMPYLKHLFAVLIVGALYLLLQPLFSPLLNKAYVYLLGLGVVGQIAFGGLVVLSVVYLLYWEVRHWRIFVPRHYCLWLILVGVLYCYYRFGVTSYPFWTITGTGCLAWLDLFALPCFVALVPRCVRCKVASWIEVLAPHFKVRCLRLVVILVRRPARRFLKCQKPPKKADSATKGEQEKDEDSDSLLVLDNPLKDRDKDELGFGELAKKLRNQLVRLKLKELSTSLGIIAPWGYGKTTFLDFLSRELEEAGDCIVVRFYPRSSRSAKYIQADFFAVLTKELSKYYFGIGLLLNRYAKSLDLLDGYDLTRPIPKLLTLLFPAEDKEAINDALRSIGKRLYIFIDDMDRLDAEEILETFKLIDRSASFSNTIFVTAYDKGYISHVLTAYLDKDSLGQCYADKYMTWEYSITEHIEEKLTGIMVGLLKKRIKDGDFVTQESVLRGWYRVAKTIVPLLGSVRHLKRYHNSFIARYVERQDEVDPGDFFLLSLLKYLDMETYLKLVREKPFKVNDNKETKTPDDPDVDIIARLIPDKMRESKEATVQILGQLFGNENRSKLRLYLDDKDIAYRDTFGIARDWNSGSVFIYSYYFEEHLKGLFLAEHMHKVLTADDPERDLNAFAPDIDRLDRRFIGIRMGRWIHYLIEGGVRNKRDLNQLIRLCEALDDRDVYLRNLAEKFYGEKLQNVLDMSNEEYRETLMTAFSALIPKHPYDVRGVAKYYLDKEPFYAISRGTSYVIGQEKSVFENETLEELFAQSLEIIYAKGRWADLNYADELQCAEDFYEKDRRKQSTLFPGLVDKLRPVVEAFPNEFARYSLIVNPQKVSGTTRIFILEIAIRPILEVILREEKETASQGKEEYIDIWINQVLDDKLKEILKDIREYKPKGLPHWEIPTLPDEAYKISASIDDRIDYVWRAIQAQKEKAKGTS